MTADEYQKQALATKDAEDKYTTSRPYLAVFVVLRQKDKIALVMRSNTAWMNGYYGLPSGKVEVGERALAAAVREAKEEVGVVIREADLKLVHTAHRYAVDYTLAWIDLVFKASKWDGEPHNAEPSKHSEFAWHNSKGLPDNVVPDVASLIYHVNQGKIYSEYRWPTAKP